MVQMSARDQQIVKGIPGNDKCCDCGMKNPQWASVSFGNVFCLECSGVHRIAMDSWTDQQLALMKGGGNDKCNQYLKAKGIAHNTPIKQKYESDAAQLYKQVLKARVEGKPEPTVLAKPAPKKPYQPQGASGGGAGDPSGMERLMGETDQQYIARQTRLRDEAKARMQAKFGGGGMGGVSSGGRMQGVGSDPNYNPHGSNDPVDSLMTGLGSMMGAAGSLARTVASEQNVQAIKSTGASFWGSFANGVSNVASGLADTTAGGAGGGGMDGLASLQREAANHRPSQSKYGGFGSDQAFGGSNNARTSSVGSMGNGSTGSGAGAGAGGALNGNAAGSLQEAPGLPGEDRNGIERLTGESDAQYVARQTRLRDEARARMAAKFGGGGSSMGGVGSSSAPSSGTGTRLAPAPSSGNSFGQARTAPNSGNSLGAARPSPAKPAASTDFFSSFGS